MSERAWRKGDLLILLMGAQGGPIVKENSIEVPQRKLKIELPYDPTFLLLDLYPDKTII